MGEHKVHGDEKERGRGAVRTQHVGKHLVNGLARVQSPVAPRLERLQARRRRILAGLIPRPEVGVFPGIEARPAVEDDGVSVLSRLAPFAMHVDRRVDEAPHQPEPDLLCVHQQVEEWRLGGRRRKIVAVRMAERASARRAI